MITAVFDTNVLASGFVRRNPDSAVVQILDAWRSGLYRLIVSEHILAELGRTLQEPYFARHLTPERRAEASAILRRQAIVTAITAAVAGGATHPEDDIVLATAVSAKADYLVTGDTKLQRLGSYEGVRILGPREFVAVLTERLGAGGQHDE